MSLREIRPRLWHWTSRHPDWTPEQGGEDGWHPEVGCYAYAARHEHLLVLFDPLLPEGDARLWDSVDQLAARYGPPHVLLTIFWHARSAAAILSRYDGARVWAYRPAKEEVEKRARVTDAFDADEPLPGGVRAIPTGADGDEVAYLVAECRALVFGDAVIAAPGGDPRVWADNDSEGGLRVRRALRAALDGPLDGPLELLLLTHGDPVLADGHAVLARALE